jgi:hypothetical protein
VDEEHSEQYDIEVLHKVQAPLSRWYPVAHWTHWVPSQALQPVMDEHD